FRRVLFRLVSFPTGRAMYPLLRYWVLLFLLALQFRPVKAQTISFSSGNLAGENINNPTSLDFGPDGRLYVSQQDGTIFAYTISRTGPGNYQVTSTEAIS